jgi:tyrosyl-tRNA synthetase
MEPVLHRTAFYKLLLRNVLRLFDVPDDQVHFVDGSAFELRKEVMLDFYRLSAIVDVQELRDCGSEYTHATRLSTIACPALPGLAEEYLDSDFQFGGEDQAGLFAFNEKYLPRLGYRKRAHLMNPMIAGLQGTKMSSSVENSKIEFLDDEETIRRKIDSSVCEDGVLRGNGLLPMIQHIVLPLCRNRAEKRGKRAPFSVLTVGEKEYADFSDLEMDFVKGEVTSDALKEAAGGWLAGFLAPLRKVYEESREWREIEDLAYGSK